MSRSEKSKFVLKAVSVDTSVLKEESSGEYKTRNTFVSQADSANMIALAMLPPRKLKMDKSKKKRKNKGGNSPTVNTAK